MKLALKSATGSSTKLSGFTIVELLVVIVVIGVLAAITIVSYTGVTTRATIASLKSDLANASKQISLFNVGYGYYPTTISSDCLAQPDSSTNKCIKPSPGNSFTYSPGLDSGSGPSTYALSINSASNLALNYMITSNSSPIAGAPLSPLADWLVVQRGDHYGNFYDLVTKSYATVTRATTKTIYDSNAKKIYDVPANQLGVRPRSDSKPGYETEIEETRMNYILNSDISSSYSFGAGVWTSDSSVPTTTRGLTGTSRTTMGRWSWTPATASKAANIAAFSGSATFAEANYAVASVFIENAVVPTGANVVLRVVAVNASGTILSNANTSIPDGAYGRYAVVSAALPAGTDRAEWEILASNNSVTGQEIRVDFTAVQLEKGAFITSYIPTTTASVTRNADVVAVPTVSSFSAGTVAAIISPPSVNSRGIYTFGTSATNQTMLYSASPTSIQSYFNANSSVTYGPSRGTTTPNNVGVWRWDATRAQNSLDSVHSSVLAVVAPSGTPTNTYIGSYYSLVNQHSGAIQRLVVYDSYLSDSAVINITDSIKNGAGS